MGRGECFYNFKMFTTLDDLKKGKGKPEDKKKSEAYSGGHNSGMAVEHPGDALVRHPNVAKISFTGSERTGKAIYETRTETRFSNFLQRTYSHGALADTNGDREGPGDDVELYVTKLQGEVRQFNQCNMFH